MKSSRPKLSVIVDNVQVAVDGGECLTAENTFDAGGVVISSTGQFQVRGNTIYSSTSQFNPAELQIGEIIGSGVSSKVRKALYRGTTPVALKQINVMSSAENRNQLVEEIKSLYKTDCAAIVKFYGVYLESTTISIVLEYLDGGSLANVLDQVGPVPERVIANMTFQVLWGLAYIKHERRLHRDIKPQNILINSRGQVKLTDFGVSKELQTSMAMGKTYVGTFKYMAPERILNKPHTFASDIFSLGMVLFELATGKSPYAEVGENHIDICIMLTSTDDSAVPALPADRFSDSFRRLVANCVSKSAADRMTPEQLLCHPWMASNGANSLDEATENVRQWIASLQRHQ